MQDPGARSPVRSPERSSLRSPERFGPYVLLKPLGRGATGDVHLARPLDLDRGIPAPVVVKRLHPGLAEKPDFVARFKHEAAIAVSVRSPHVARVYDVGRSAEFLYIVMEYVPGWAVSELLTAVQQSGLHASIASVVDLMSGALRGLMAVHSARDAHTDERLRIVHRDISPKNLMIGEDAVLRLIDFGLGSSAVQDWRTRTGMVMGSPGYMAPEQVRGERADLRADLYSLGIIGYEMIALRSYIQRGSVEEMVARSFRPTFQPPSKYRPDVPPELDRIFERALRLDPSERFPGAASFLEALTRAVPETYSRGSMQSLLEDLFGSAREARSAEVDRLLALPTPPAPADAPEDTPVTEVFATRVGVIADEASLRRTAVDPVRPGIESEARDAAARLSPVRVIDRARRKAPAWVVLLAAVFGISAGAIGMRWLASPPVALEKMRVNGEAASVEAGQGGRVEVIVVSPQVEARRVDPEVASSQAVEARGFDPVVALPPAVGSKGSLRPVRAKPRAVGASPSVERPAVRRTSPELAPAKAARGGRRSTAARASTMAPPERTGVEPLPSNEDSEDLVLQVARLDRRLSVLHDRAAAARKRAADSKVRSALGELLNEIGLARRSEDVEQMRRVLRLGRARLRELSVGLESPP